MRICADSGFLIALYDETDGYHQKALACFQEYIEEGPHTLLIPWPVMYETISTRMARAGRRMETINAHLKSVRLKRKLELLDDSPFRDQAINKCFPATPPRPHRALSLVDLVIREILSHRAVRSHALATFNRRDFHDVCWEFRKKILPDL